MENLKTCIVMDILRIGFFEFLITHTIWYWYYK